MKTNPFFYRFDCLTMVPGNKTSGFLAYVSTEVLCRLRAMPISIEEYQNLIVEMRTRLQRAKLLSKPLLAQSGVVVLNQTACPQVFMTDPMVGASISMSPNEAQYLTEEDAVDRIGDTIAFTPHNADSPNQAMALMVMFETWAEWAYGKLLLADALTAIESVDGPGTLGKES